MNQYNVIIEAPGAINVARAVQAAAGQVTAIATLVTSDHQPQNPTQVAALRAVLGEFAAFVAASPVPVARVIHCGDVVHEATTTGGVAPAYGYPEYLADWYSRNLPALVTIPGNHDRDATGENLHPLFWSFLTYQRYMGPLFHAQVQGNTLWLCMGDMAGATGGEQIPEALTWFEEMLARSDGMNVIVILHQPLYGAYGASVAAYEADGFPDPNDISDAYQYWSERIATAIEARSNVAAVFYGHVGGASYAASTQVEEQFGTVHINCMMGLENSGRIENGGALDIPNHYAVLYWTHGATSIRMIRRDAKTGAEISGSTLTLDTAYPVNLKGEVFDGRYAAQRVDAVIDRSLTVHVDVAEQREETSPGFWDIVHGIRYPLTVAATDTANDNIAVGDGVGIMLRVPGADTFGASGEQKMSVNSSFPGGAVAAEKAIGTDGDERANVLLQAADPTLGDGIDRMKTVLRGFGTAGTVEFPFGIYPMQMQARGADTASGANDADLFMADVTVPALNIAEWGEDGVPDNIPTWWTYGFMFAFQSSVNSKGRLIPRRTGSGGILFQNYTGGAWQNPYTVDMTSVGAFASVTGSTYTVGDGVQFIRINVAGTCTVTLPAASGANQNRRIQITTLQGAVISASSNVLPAASGTAGTAILPAVAGASCWLISNGTTWQVVGASQPLAASVADPRLVPGVWVNVPGSSGAQVAHTGTTDLTVARTITVPGGWIGPNGRLRIRPEVTIDNTPDEKDVVITFGGTEIHNPSVGALDDLTGWATDILLVNRGVQNSQFFRAITATSSLSTTTSSAATTATVDTSVDQDLVVSLQVGNSADTIRLESIIVEVMYLP